MYLITSYLTYKFINLLRMSWKDLKAIIVENDIKKLKGKDNDDDKFGIYKLPEYFKDTENIQLLKMVYLTRKTIFIFIVFGVYTFIYPIVFPVRLIKLFFKSNDSLKLIGSDFVTFILN